MIRLCASSTPEEPLKIESSSMADETIQSFFEGSSDRPNRRRTQGINLISKAAVMNSSATQGITHLKIGR